MYRKPTIREVAQRAGVSVTTVSHFMSGRNGTCSPKTAERIKTAISDLHYSPSSQGRALRLGKTRTIGVCTEAIFELNEHARESFAERLWRGISAVAGASEYALLHYPPSDRTGSSTGPFLDGRVDGLILSSEHGDTRPKIIALAGLPIIIINRPTGIPDNCGAVFADESQTVSLALNHLWSLGHRRIAHVAGPIRHKPDVIHGRDAQSDVAIERCNQYVNWMQDHDAYDPQLNAIENSWLPRDPEGIVRSWRQMPHPPTAVFCADDFLAYGIIDAAQAMGISVPGQLSVIGVDNSWASASRKPRLTSIDIPTEQIGRTSVEALMQIMSGTAAEECRIAIPVTDLVERETAAPLHRHA